MAYQLMLFSVVRFTPQGSPVVTNCNKPPKRAVFSWNEVANDLAETDQALPEVPAVSVAQAPLLDSSGPRSTTTWCCGIRPPRPDKPVVVDLKLAPLVLEDLRRMGIVSRRGPVRLVKRVDGPIIANEATGLPWFAFEFRRVWRTIARSEGVPDNVCNMHSRHGGISEGFDAGANPDNIRAAATHSDLATTQGYNRGNELERSSRVLIARARHRGKRKPLRRSTKLARRPNRQSTGQGRAA